MNGSCFQFWDIINTFQVAKANTIDVFIIFRWTFLLPFVLKNNSLSVTIHFSCDPR